jgi:hypothetical protein
MNIQKGDVLEHYEHCTCSRNKEIHTTELIEISQVKTERRTVILVKSKTTCCKCKKKNERFVEFRKKRK